jgi:hypothetical protein
VSDENPYAYPGCESVRLRTFDDLVAAIISAADARPMNYCLYEARRRGVLRGVFHRLASMPAPSARVKTAFHSAWVTQGLWWRDNLNDDDLLLDVMRKFMPGYTGPPLELFRGERWSNHESGKYGLSWTTERSIAEMFARGLNDCEVTGGVLLRTIAGPDAIIAVPNDHSQYLGESEYVVDRRELHDVEVLERLRSSKRDTDAT